MKTENHILEIPKFFSKKECKDIMATYDNNLQKSLFYDCINIDINKFNYFDKIKKVINIYIKKYPEIDMTASYWQLESLRFKKFKKGQSFSNWHSEHCFKKVIKSEIGKVVLFPAFYTHTHRGQVCPENKNRYIITGYFNFYKPSEKEEDKKNV
jgi:hypothetical protein